MIQILGWDLPNLAPCAHGAHHPLGLREIPTVRYGIFDGLAQNTPPQHPPVRGKPHLRPIRIALKKDQHVQKLKGCGGPAIYPPARNFEMMQLGIIGAQSEAVAAIAVGRVQILECGVIAQRPVQRFSQSDVASYAQAMA